MQSSGPTTIRTAYDASLAREDCAEILKDPSIRTCEPNFVQYLTDTFPNDPGFYGSVPFQWGLYSPFSNGTSSFDMRAHKGWDHSTGSQSVVVGILDSGINFNHPDLIPNLWHNPGEIAGNSYR
jgi:hypothetical protein